jgi:hypothetical protein
LQEVPDDHDVTDATNHKAADGGAGLTSAGTHRLAHAA